MSPDIITLNETNMKGSNKPEVPGYYAFNKNRKGKNGGGVCTLIKESEKGNTLKVKEGKDGKEFIVTRHSQFLVPINVINIYGEQECRTSKEKIKENWDEILEIVNHIEGKGEHVVISGDLNVHLADTITGNNDDKITYGGSLLLEFLENGNYILINATNLVKDGPYTRYDPSAPNDDKKKSALDLFIVSKALFKYVDSLVIDKNLINTAARITKDKTTYSDHYSCILTLKNLPKKPTKKITKSKIIFNTNKEGGWKAYNELTTNNKRLTSRELLESRNTNTIMNKIGREMEKCKYKAFGKVKTKINNRKNTSLNELMSRRE